jgi:TolA-binding protein
VGVTGNIRQKIASLQKLVADFPKSPYNDDARFEIGQAQMTLNQHEEALQTFRKLVADHPNSSFVKRSLLNTGLIYYNTERNQQALETFKKVVKDYPATPESREALAVIKNIYVDMNQVDEYVAYSQDIPFANITRSEQDSLTFIAVEGRYMGGDCSKAIPGFASYLDKFPNGIFSVKAHYFKADCESRAGNHAEALKSYEFILSKPRTGYTENSALKAAEILFRMKDYAKALQMYERLEENAENPTSLQESYLGQMRCNFYLGNHGIAVQMGQKVLETARLSPNLVAEIHLITGKSYMSLQRYETARVSFENVLKISQGEAGAEALYNLATISYEQKDYTTAESQIFRLSGDYASYDYWVARSFILLSDVYIKTGNVFQARQTLQSIIDNYEGEDLRKIAADKLGRINQGESSSQPATKTFDDEEGIIIR